MNKQQVNLEIAKLIYPNEIIHVVQSNLPAVLIHTLGRLDYCNNIADLWPHILEHGISIRKDGVDEWVVHHYGMKTVFTRNPQLGLAACLLKVLEAKEKTNDRPDKT